MYWRWLRALLRRLISAGFILYVCCMDYSWFLAHHNELLPRRVWQSGPKAETGYCVGVPIYRKASMASIFPLDRIPSCIFQSHFEILNFFFGCQWLLESTLDIITFSNLEKICTISKMLLVKVANHRFIIWWWHTSEFVNHSSFESVDIIFRCRLKYFEWLFLQGKALQNIFNQLFGWLNAFNDYIIFSLFGAIFSLIRPRTWRPKLATQWHLSTGFLNEHPAAVLATIIPSIWLTKNMAVTADCTWRNVIWRSPPSSV